MTNRCAVAGCRGEVDLIYLGHGVCSDHWNQLADDDSFSRLRMVLGIETAAPAMEVAMNETTTAETTIEPNKEDAVPKKKTAKTKVAKPAKQAKAAKQAKPKKEKAPKGPKPDRVFAFRCTTPELEAIHRTAGPRNASQFIRSVAAAFAAEDHAAFKAVIEEARKLRG